MGKRIPRRLQRYYRDGGNGDIPEDAAEELRQQEMDLPEEESIGETIYEQSTGQSDNKEKTMEMALQEVKRFKKTHKRLPKKDEYERISENIFEQLKKEREKEKLLQKTGRVKKRISRKDREPRGRKGRSPKRKEEAIPTETPLPKKKEINSALSKIKGLDVSDLFDNGEEKKKGEEKGDFEELSDLNLGPMEEDEIKEINEDEGVGSSCPNCKAPASNAIYCPCCGNAYCEKCAKKVEKLPDRTRYFCPHCGKTIEK